MKEIFHPNHGRWCSITPQRPGGAVVFWPRWKKSRKNMTEIFQVVTEFFHSMTEVFQSPSLAVGSHADLKS